MQNLLKEISDLFVPSKPPIMELAAIWLNKRVKTEKENVYRISKGDRVLIKNGEILDVIDTPSHEIRRCYGTATDNFSIVVINLKTLELSEIKL